MTTSPARIVLTGEYPPQPGGVSDHTRAVAAALAAAGEEVHVWAPPCDPGGQGDDGVRVHRLAGGFGPAALRRLGRELDGLSRDRRILLQYVPHAFGYRSMNLPLCRWLARRPEPLDVVFHEVSYPFQLTAAGLVLPLAHRLMARTLAPAISRAFVSTASWEPLLRSLGVRAPVVWLPVPSNLPEKAEPAAAASVRARLGGGPERPLLGHFGTFGEAIAALLARVLERLLREEGRRALLVGRGGERFAARLGAAAPALAGRLHATGDLPAPQAAAHLAACDLLLQPYPDGVSTRRGSVMGGLALGSAIVSNRGPLTEPVWEETRSLALAPDPDAMVPVAEALLGDEPMRRRLAERAAATYRERFSLESTVRALRAAAAPVHERTR